MFHLTYMEPVLEIYGENILHERPLIASLVSLTELILIDACHVGATFGCDAIRCLYPDLLDRDLEVAPTGRCSLITSGRAQRPAPLD